MIQINNLIIPELTVHNLTIQEAENIVGGASNFQTEIGASSNSDTKTDFSRIASEFKDSNQKILLVSMDYQTETTMISAVQKMQKSMVDNLKQGVG